MNSFPVDKLSEKTNMGFQLKAFNPEDDGHQPSEDLGVHRDDHYIFFLLTGGSGSMLIDFEERTVQANQLYYILPHQVHYRIRTDQASGWFVAVDPSLVYPECRAALDGSSGLQAPLSLSTGDLVNYHQVLSLLYNKSANNPTNGSTIKVLRSLVQTFLAMAAESFRGLQQLHERDSRPTDLAMQFKKLLKQNFRNYKNPSAYAEMLHVSEPYLNESVKKVTGYTVTAWIRQEILIEAKRMLYYTDLTVKQVADTLGYENYSYFCRFFRKEAGMPALEFRRKFREAGFKS